MLTLRTRLGAASAIAIATVGLVADAAAAKLHTIQVLVGSLHVVAAKANSSNLQGNLESWDDFRIQEQATPNAISVCNYQGYYGWANCMMHCRRRR